MVPLPLSMTMGVLCRSPILVQYRVERDEALCYSALFGIKAVEGVLGVMCWLLSSPSAP